jgi:hypothetical protein
MSHFVGDSVSAYGIRIELSSLRQEKARTTGSVTARVLIVDPSMAFVRWASLLSGVPQSALRAVINRAAIAVNHNIAGLLLVIILAPNAHVELPLGDASAWPREVSSDVLFAVLSSFRFM